MLASTAKGVAEAIAEIGRSSVEWKLDGVRIQVHKHDDVVRVWTRNLNEITGGVPEVVRVVREFDARTLVLDGEVLGVDEAGDPLKFQDTMASESTVAPFFFDLLHHDGDDLLDIPLEQRLQRLEAVVGDRKIPGVITDVAGDAGQAVLDEALARRHEGRGGEGGRLPLPGRSTRARRGARSSPSTRSTSSCSPSSTAAGVATGWLSNIHLGARDPETGGFVMVGKTFKGMTDDMLRWQTERFARLRDPDDDGLAGHAAPRAGGGDRPRRGAAFDQVPRRASRCASLGWCAIATTSRPDEADTIDAVRSLG